MSGRQLVGPGRNGVACRGGVGPRGGQPADPVAAEVRLREGPDAVHLLHDTTKLQVDLQQLEVQALALVWSQVRHQLRTADMRVAEALELDKRIII